MIRQADLSDLSTLLKVEMSCFEGDRFTPRVFRYLLTKGHATTLIAEKNKKAQGYCIVLFRRGSRVARLYSIAVLPEGIGSGVGQSLLLAAEDAAKLRGCYTIILEVREDNNRAIRFYEKMAYHCFGKFNDFYEDHSDALRFKKQLCLPS